MKIIVGDNPPIDSNDTPVLIQLDNDDVERIRTKPDDHDVIVFHPSHWPDANVRRWASSKIDALNGKKGVVTIDSEQAKDDHPVAEGAVSQPPVENTPSVENTPPVNEDPQPEAEEASGAEEGSPSQETIKDSELLDLLGI